MEFVSMAQEVLHNAAEHVASYRLGQSVLRYLDRALWVVEKCARWAVPAPLDQDERPQPELVRPLPWVFFLALLVTLRVTRESISLVNLIMGKPPLRSADVVTYIQSKRRYLRTLKYAGGRVLRARGEPRYSGPLARLRALLAFGLCWRPQPAACHNNNTHDNTDELMVVKRSKPRRQQASSPPPTEATYERLIENMMIELNADSDDDSSFTLTNATSTKSDRSEYAADSDQDTVFQQDITTTEPTHCSTPTKHNGGKNDTLSDLEEDQSEIRYSKTVNEDVEDSQVNASPKTESTEVANESSKKDTNEHDQKIVSSNNNSSEVGNTNASSNNESVEQNKTKKEKEVEENNASSKKNSESERTNGTQKKTNIPTPEREKKNGNKSDSTTSVENKEIENNKCEQNKSCEDSALPPPDDKKSLSPKEETQNFVHNESTPQKSHNPSKNEKLANGRTVKSVPAKKKGIQERRHVPVTSNNSF